MKRQSDAQLAACKAETQRWGKEFEHDGLYQTLSAAEQREMPFIIGILTELMYGYHLLKPQQWTPKALEQICKDIMPRKISAEMDFFASIEPVLTAFFHFCGQKGYLKKAHTLENRLRKIAPEMLHTASNKENWGMGKQLFMEAKEGGFLDESNDETLRKSLNLYLAGQQEKGKEPEQKNSIGERYQLIVTLKGHKPAIWRRVLVPSKISFSKLHKIIQAAFGWQNLWDYSFNGHTLKREKIDKLLVTEKKITYLYDFEDKWEHEILLEKVLVGDEQLTVPFCLAGARNRPPEGVGGMGGYTNFLRVIRNGKHPQYDETLLWAEKDTGGRKFDPDYFYLNEINRALQKIK